MCIRDSSPSLSFSLSPFLPPSAFLAHRAAHRRAGGGGGGGEEERERPVSSAICLRACYAMSGTNIAYADVSLSAYADATPCSVMIYSV
eukprot:3273493-Rhodomonas_salina.1